MYYTWFGHRPACPAANKRPRRSSPRGAAVCRVCMPDFVPRCGACGIDASVSFAADGWIEYTFSRLCPACVARIQAAGPPRERRAAAQQARVELLITRHPGLVVTRSDSGQRVQLDGCVTGRVVRLTLRQSAREGTLERYVFKVALRTPPEQVSLGDLRLTPEFLARTAALPPTLTRDDHRWLRVGFLHLGKLDVLTALDGLITTAEHLDG